MRRLAVLVVMAASAPLLRGQTVPGIISIPPQQCVWHAGDNPAWAAPNLDESGWQPYAQWNLNPAQPRIWVRCHVDLSALRSAENPAMQVSLYAAYQLYVEGALIGSNGNVRSGVFSMNTMRSFAIPETSVHPATIALRVTSRLVDLLPANALPPLELAAGSESDLRGRRAGRLLTQSGPHLFLAVSFSFIGVAGLILFGLFLSERDRREYFLLSVMSISLAGIYLDYLLAAALVSYSCSAYLLLFAGSALALDIARPVFCFALAKRPVPAVFWILIVLGSTLYIATGISSFLPSAQALRLNAFCRLELMAPCNLALAAASTAPFFAFWPYTQLSRRLRPIAGLCLVLGASVIVLFLVVSTAWGRLPGIPDLAARWNSVVSETEACIMFCVLAALFALLFREHRQVAEERAILTGEMQAAREIQRMIAPATVEPVPGLHIEVAFRPMREVGGDFYQIIRCPADATLVVIGDVSGKGLRAAMTGTLAVGALRTLASEASGPALLLTRLNSEIAKTQHDGFITCLCVRILGDGTLTLANAGHLAPYRNGDEVQLESGLPLGITADAIYAESTLTLAPGDSLTFLSDGVVEAQSPTGELFGFDRTRQISTQSADNIARAAQAHGQQDDITVLTLQFAPAEVLHA